MHSGKKLPLIKENVPMTRAIIEMTKKRFGCLGVISKKNKLIGIITDGDLRRLLLKDKDINLTAILGPTNTGKTYTAFERLISYKSGIFGFPLRLLARENYDKAVSKLGSKNVALITGEEKIFPKTAKYFFCTVESMPLNIDVECIAIDEVQLASD